jgi:hypothetical protein
MLALAVLLRPLPAFAAQEPPVCPAPATIADLIIEVRAAEAAFREMDDAAFAAATERIDAALPCVNEPISTSTAATMHRMMGLRAFLDADAPRAGRAFGAARTVDPQYAFPPDLLPAGNPIQIAYLSIPVDSRETVQVAQPVEGNFTFDGRRATERPLRWPTVVQRFDKDGNVEQTAYLWPDAPMFPYLEVPAPPAPVDRHLGRTVVLGGAIGSGLAAGAFYGVAAKSARQFDEAVGEEEGDRFARRANAFVAASGVAGTFSVGLAVGGVLW